MYVSIIYFHTLLYSFFFFNDTATTEIYTLSLHDALPISQYAFNTGLVELSKVAGKERSMDPRFLSNESGNPINRSEEHTSELQSRPHLVCRLLLEKKKKKKLTK